MASHRRNTLVVDFVVLPKRPGLQQVETFLKEFIKVDMADVRNIQLHNIKNCLFIEMNDSGVAPRPRLQKQHHLQHYFTLEGIRYYIPVYVDGPTSTVRVHDLPPQMDNDVISDHLQQYGQVISIQNEVWKNYFAGIPNGVRIVRMRMDKPIPSHIVVNNHSTYVSCANKSNQTTTARGTKKQQQRTPSSSAHERDIQNDNEPQAAQINDDHSDVENDDDDNDDHGWTNENDTATENTDNDSAKRRLSTESNRTEEENAAKRSCNPGTQKTDLEWKMITRSKKKTDIVIKSQ
ncbi:uncharacterized protein LOC134285615 [Aedes albopictus]|uniref:Translation elongation factor ef-1 alpha/tu n=1 Tax=Aedes albopictus TaxID=7160 RepID=A0ABM1Z392_AEDAL